MQEGEMAMMSNKFKPGSRIKIFTLGVALITVFFAAYALYSPVRAKDEVRESARKKSYRDIFKAALFQTRSDSQDGDGASPKPDADASPAPSQGPEIPESASAEVLPAQEDVQPIAPAETPATPVKPAETPEAPVNPAGYSFLSGFWGPGAEPVYGFSRLSPKATESLFSASVILFLLGLMLFTEKRKSEAPFYKDSRPQLLIRRRAAYEQ